MKPDYYFTPMIVEAALAIAARHRLHLTGFDVQFIDLLCTDVRLSIAAPDGRTLTVSRLFSNPHLFNLVNPRAYLATELTEAVTSLLEASQA